ncbi:cation:proton antiporter [bacterium]|nr:cation:proton antiporter [bacterium]
MEFEAYQSITIALVLGVGSYILSRRLKIPAILFYLFCGILAGKVGFGIINPESLGNGLHILLEIVIATILFEGGLSLSSHGFRAESAAIRRILIITLPLTGLGATLLAHYLLDLPWQYSVFFGALIVVTGPTVIGSILKSVFLPRRLEIVLNWESIWGDVIGVLLSAVALEVVNLNLTDSAYEIGAIFVLRIISGILIGIASGFILSKILSWISVLRDSALYGIVSLTGAIATFYFANVVLHSSGPLAAAVSGFYLSNTKKECLHDIRHFKDQVSSIFVSTIFVLLSALINPLPLIHLWPMMILIALILGGIIRPLSVLAALYRTSIPFAERLYIGIIGPRGIIAVATAAYAAIVTTGHEKEMSLVLNLTFAIIFFSGTIATILCRPLARVLKVLVPDSQTGMLIVGINPFSSAIAEFAREYIPVSFMETDRTKCLLASDLGLETICTDLLDSSIYEDALEEGFGRLLAATRNDALNELIASKAAMHLDPNQVFRVPDNSDSESIRMTSSNNQNIAFHNDFSLSNAADKIHSGNASLIIMEPAEFNATGAIPLFEITDKGKGLRIVLQGETVNNTACCLLIKP